MNELTLIKSADFNGIAMDCYADREKENTGDFWATREQIGTLLEYADPRISISNIHQRNKERLDKFSAVINLITPSGTQPTTLYNFKGLLEICRYSQQPKADAVMDWLWEVADEIRKTGSYTVKAVPDKISLPVMESAHFLLSTAGIKGNQLTIALDNLFHSYTGHSVLKEGHVELPAPSQRQLLTPTEIGNQLGISPRKVNDILAGAGYQHKIANMWEPLGEGEHYAVMMDVGKRRNAGTPIRQLKWDSAIIEIMKCLLDPDEEEAS